MGIDISRNAQKNFKNYYGTIDIVEMPNPTPWGNLFVPWRDLMLDIFPQKAHY